MAHILVAHSDHSVRAVLALALGEEGMHDVIRTSDAAITVAVLWSASTPMVALIDERLHPFDAWGIIAAAANYGLDGIGGPLSRHRYILLSTSPDTVRAAKRRALSMLGARTLAMPFELETLLHIVDVAASYLVADQDPRGAETLQGVLPLRARHFV